MLYIRVHIIYNKTKFGQTEAVVHTHTECATQYLLYIVL